MIDYEKIERFNKWKNNWEKSDLISLSDYISHNIYPEEILIISSLIFPSVIKVNECVFFSDNYDEKVYKTLSSNLNNAEVEKQINRMHIYDVFAHCTEEVDDSVFEKVGRFLQMAWSNYFCMKYPNKKIIVDYYNDDESYGPVLTVYQNFDENENRYRDQS
ncbi:MAG: hypothetical protein N4A35_12350 [Flavobacteriales bacterium]|jgi:hypothetical protein|nr:hypothetical protein [Flavobacteriales bacterium]